MLKHKYDTVITRTIIQIRKHIKRQCRIW